LILVVSGVVSGDSAMGVASGAAGDDAVPPPGSGGFPTQPLSKIAPAPDATAVDKNLRRENLEKLDMKPPGRQSLFCWIDYLSFKEQKS
jgi:hypothetical protein